MYKINDPYEFLSTYLLRKFKHMGFLEAWIDGEKERIKNNSKYNPKVNTCNR